MDLIYTEPELAPPDIKFVQQYNHGDSKFKWSAVLTELADQTKLEVIPHFYFGKEMSTSGKRYYCATSYPTFFEKYEKMSAPCYHEQFISTTPKRLFFDIEAPKLSNYRLGSDDDFITNVIIGVVIPVCVRVINKTFEWAGIEWEVLPSDFRILVACSFEKYSCHLICKTIYFSSMETLFNFTTDIFSECEKIMDMYIIKDEKKKPIFDLKKFQSLRIYYSCKLSEPTRPFYYYCQEQNKIIIKYDLQILKDTLIGYIPPNEIVAVIDYTQIYSKPYLQPIVMKRKRQDGPVIELSQNMFGIKFRNNSMMHLIQLYKKYNIPIKIDQILLNEHVKYRDNIIIIPVTRGLCIHKWSESKSLHKNPSGLSIIINVESGIFKMKCLHEESVQLPHLMLTLDEINNLFD